MIDISIAVITHREGWIPWTVYQVNKQVAHLVRMKLVVQVVFLLHNISGNYKPILKTFENIGYKVIEVNGERTIGELRNLVCDETTGKYVAFMDSDDWYLESRLHRQWRSLEFQAHHRKFTSGPHKGDIIPLAKSIICTVCKYPCINLDTGHIYYADHISESCMMFIRDHFDGPQSENRFSESMVGEANKFIERQCVNVIDDIVLMVAMDHGKIGEESGANTVPRLVACEGTTELLMLLDPIEKELLTRMGYGKILSRLNKE